MRIEEFPPIAQWHYYSTLIHHTDEIRCLRFTNDGIYLVSTGWDRTICLWNLQQNPPELYGNLIGHENGITEIIIDENNLSIVSVSKDGTLRLWDLMSMALKEIITRFSGRIYCVAVDPQNNFLITGGDDHHCRIWVIKKNAIGNWIGIQHLHTLTGPQATIHRIIFDRSGRNIICIGDEPDLYVWHSQSNDWRNNNISGPKIWQGHSKRIFALAQIPDSNFIITGSEDKTLRIWDIITGQFIRSISTPIACSDIWMTFNLPWAITSTIRNSVLLWDLPNWSLKQSIEYLEGKMQTIAISRNGNWLAIAPFGIKDPRIWLWRKISS